MTASITAYANQFTNLIEFDSTAMRYFNTARAETQGFEVATDVDVVPGLIRLKTAYTYLEATDLRTGLTLARRPRNVARASLAITPTAQWLIEPRVTAVSQRFSSSNELNPLDPYVRVDLYTEYKLDKNWTVFGRGENILNARYQEVLNFGTTARPAAYAGLNAKW